MFVLSLLQRKPTLLPLKDVNFLQRDCRIPVQVLLSREELLVDGDDAFGVEWRYATFADKEDLVLTLLPFDPWFDSVSSPTCDKRP